MGEEASVLDRLITELVQQRSGGALALGTRATPSTPSQPYYTGPNSLFGVLGLERDLISSRTQPIGLADRLPVVGTQVINPLFGYFTGFDPATGPQPNGVCDDPPTVGAGRTCYQTAQLGRYSYQTRTLEVNHLGQQINRGEMQDLRFLNDPLAGGVGGITTPRNIPQNINLRREVLMRQVELGAQFQLVLARQLYEGNPANNTAGGGYAEFPGLDILVNANKIDAITGTRCQNLDSDIKNFNNQLVDSAPANTPAGTNILRVLGAMARFLRMRADSQNFGSVDWAIVMRPALFWELSAIWPCVYFTDRCGLIGGQANVNNVEASAMVALRDNMRNQNYITIDGLRYPVILDNTIREDTSINTAGMPSGRWASDIYFLPLRIRGGYPVLYWEHFDFSGENGTMQGIQDARASSYYWTDGGRYLWHLKPPQNWCLQWMAKIEPRIILRTPQLAGRITNVAYSMLQHEDDPYPTDPYFVTGGVGTGRPAPSLTAEWGSVKTSA